VPRDSEQSEQSKMQGKKINILNWDYESLRQAFEFTVDSSIDFELRISVATIPPYSPPSCPKCILMHNHLKDGIVMFRRFIATHPSPPSEESPVDALQQSAHYGVHHHTECSDG